MWLWKAWHRGIEQGNVVLSTLFLIPVFGLKIMKIYQALCIVNYCCNFHDWQCQLGNIHMRGLISFPKWIFSFGYRRVQVCTGTMPIMMGNDRNICQDEASRRSLEDENAPCSYCCHLSEPNDHNYMWHVIMSDLDCDDDPVMGIGEVLGFIRWPAGRQNTRAVNITSSFFIKLYSIFKLRFEALFLESTVNRGNIILPARMKAFMWTYLKETCSFRRDCNATIP